MVLRKGGEPWDLTELDLDEPKAGDPLGGPPYSIDLTYPTEKR